MLGYEVPYEVPGLNVGWPYPRHMFYLYSPRAIILGLKDNPSLKNLLWFSHTFYPFLGGEGAYKTNMFQREKGLYWKELGDTRLMLNLKCSEMKAPTPSEFSKTQVMDALSVKIWILDLSGIQIYIK